MSDLDGWPDDRDIERERIRKSDADADAACAEYAIDIPVSRLSQVGLTFRRAANEFHGALARDPGCSSAGAWLETAEWFDSVADELLAAVNAGPSLVKLK